MHKIYKTTRIVYQTFVVKFSVYIILYNVDLIRNLFVMITLTYCILFIGFFYKTLVIDVVLLIYYSNI